MSKYANLTNSLGNSLLALLLSALPIAAVGVVAASL
jgi:hypothetical protein